MWRSSKSDVPKDYRMTSVTFRVSVSSFAANMSVKQNTVDFTSELQRGLLNLISSGRFLLCKWNSSDLTVIEIQPELHDSEGTHHISDRKENTTKLGLEWNTKLDEFHFTLNEAKPSDRITKRVLVSDIAKALD